MHFDNYATRTRRELLIRTAKLFFEGNFAEHVDRIPLSMRPRNGKSMRCCVYKDRAIIKYRLMAIMGFGVEDEKDELTSLKEYALIKSETTKEQPVLTLIDEACTACVQGKYFVTNACRGCMARPCKVNCPKKAISEGEQGQAKIDPTACVNCGICMKVCPYHAIIRIPVPCEEACPVGAIEKDASGKAHIDFDKCILCGKCMRECPFGAITERSHFTSVLDNLVKGRKMVLMIAPAVIGQFVAQYAQILSAIFKLGFHDVIEVAHGAVETALNEAAEFEHRIGKGASFMTTSCCPSYIQAIKKHTPALASKVSSTPTPLNYTSRNITKLYPDAIKVFVSPCIAKRKEAQMEGSADLVITCEELGAIIAARGIDVAQCEPVEVKDPAGKYGRGFPASGGVTTAVCQFLNEPDILKPRLIDGLSRQNMKLLKVYSGPKGIPGANFLEVMACEGGCVNGPCTMENPAQAKKRISELMD